ncbi:MAG TPA: VOC family protein, partial [Candidatus Hodarchaeales archaeon]|nr:VOC family protein [Candidatus Hodarchaeales archaeon]
MDVVNLFVKNMERTVEFYRLLGFHLPEGVEKKGYIKTGDSGTPLCFYSFSLVEQYFGNKIKGNFAGHPTELSVRLNNPTVVDEMFRRVVEAGFSAFQDP